MSIYICLDPSSVSYFSLMAERTLHYPPYIRRTNRMHNFSLMISFNYIVFDMFRTTKCSSSGRLAHAALRYFVMQLYKQSSTVFQLMNT